MLDPACGWGNFLYLALQALKDPRPRLQSRSLHHGEGRPRHRLQEAYVSDWRLVEENQRAALAGIVHGISRLDAAGHWGDRTTSASDGQRFAIPHKVPSTAAFVRAPDCIYAAEAPQVRITHPFHPLRGTRFPFVVTRSLWGEDRVTVQRPDGSAWSIPVGWTDLSPPDPAARVGRGRTLFRLEDLQQLAEWWPTGRRLLALGESSPAKPCSTTSFGRPARESAGFRPPYRPSHETPSEPSGRPSSRPEALARATRMFSFSATKATPAMATASRMRQSDPATGRAARVRGRTRRSPRWRTFITRPGVGASRIPVRRRSPR